MVHRPPADRRGDVGCRPDRRKRDRAGRRLGLQQQLQGPQQRRIPAGAEPAGEVLPRAQGRHRIDRLRVHGPDRKPGRALADRRPRDEDRLAPACQRRRLALRGRPRDLTRRTHRLCERVLRPALLRAAEVGDQPGDPHGRGGSILDASDPARRLADRAGRTPQHRPRHGRRDPRGDDHPADHLRHARRGRPAADRRAARARHGDRPDRGAHARRRRRQLHARARGDDRARRRHRLRALHSDPLPLRPRRGARARRGDRHGDGHIRSSRAVRRRDRGDRHARTATGGRQLPARTGDRLLAHGAPDDGGGAHAASRRPLQARARYRPLRRIRPASAERAADRPRLLGALGGDDPAPAAGLRAGVVRPPAGPRLADSRAAPGIGGRRHRCQEHDDPPGLRSAREGLRRGLQRPDADRGEAAVGRRHRRRS